jgi:hypothetical protein
MKYQIPTYIYIIIGAMVGLIAIYIGFSILRRTQEGLTDGPSTANDDIEKRVINMNTMTNGLLTKLTASPQSYINLCNSYKNMKIAQGITDIVTTQKSSQFVNVSDYDEAIDYLKTLGASDISAINDDAINQITETNKTNTSAILEKLTADNQAYIDLLTSIKNNKLAIGLQTGEMTISEIDIAINYLITLGGHALAPNTQPETPTTPNISFARPPTYAE